MFELGISFTRYKGLQFFYSKRWIFLMKHRMTIWADWSEVFDWVDLILFADRGDRDQMMYMDEATTKLAVGRLKGEPADEAACSVMLDAGLSCGLVALALRIYYTA